MVVIDATILMLFLKPGSGVPLGRDKRPIDKPTERIEFLIRKLDKARTKVVIPAPALSEVLVRAEPVEAQTLIERVGGMAVFRIEPFDQRAAIEVAAMTRNSQDGGMKPRRRDPQATWAKLKYDRQIVAIAVVNGIRTIYSDDSDIRTIAKRAGIEVIGLADLELPPEDAQFEIDFEESDVGEAASEVV